MINEKLTQRQEISITEDGAFLHIVNGGLSRKVSKANLFGNRLDAVETAVSSISGGYQGRLMIADTPTDGYYVAGEAGTFTNAGGLVVTITNKLTIIFVSSSATVFAKTEIDLLDYLVEPTVSDMISNAVTGQRVQTLGYSSSFDGGGMVYNIVTDGTLTEDGGTVINISGSVYAVAARTDSLTNRHFGIFSDSTTVWTTTNATAFNGLLAASVTYGITFESPTGTYFNVGLNFNTTHSGGQVHFRNAAFAGIVHVVGDDLTDQIDGMILTGHVITYDRYGTTWANNIKGKLNITCKSDDTINTLGTEGRGVHIYYATKNHNYGNIIIENAPYVSSATEAAFALDGENNTTLGTEAPQNHTIDLIWVQNTNIRGAQITGSGHNIGTIRIDNYGSDVFEDTLSYLGSGTTTWNGDTINQICQGVLFWNADCHVNQIIVDQNSGFSGRSRALTDVAIGRTYIKDITGVVNYNTGVTIDSIISRNPQRQSLSIGEYKNVTTAKIGSVQIGVIDANNLMQLNASSERSTYGLVDCYYAHVQIDSIRVEDPLSVVMLMQRDVYSSGSQRQSVGVNVGMLSTPEINSSGYVGYDIFQGKIGYIMCWIDANNKSEYIAP